MKWCFASAENDDTRFRSQALKNRAQKLGILRLTALRNYNPEDIHLQSAYSTTFAGFILQFL